MPVIKSPNPDFKRLEVPTEEHGYVHPLETERGISVNGTQQLGGAKQIASARRAIPMAFQVTSPFNRRRVLLPHALVLHVNPNTINETHNQKVERFQTRGGFVEQHWGHDLVEISADASTGAFMHIKTGLTSVLRQRTIAWDRYRDLHDLYLNNGSIRNPFGDIVLQGHIMLMYDRGVYLGTFRTFSVDETDDSPFAFSLSWAFKIEHTLTQVADNSFFGPQPRAPSFQFQNIPINAASGGVTGSGQAASGNVPPVSGAPPQVGGSPDPATQSPPPNTGFSGRFGPPNDEVIPP